MGALKVLQYNVNKSRNKVLAPLLADRRVREYDVIAIQEPWRNTYDSAAYNPRGSGFTLIDQGVSGSRVSIYINNRLAEGSWSGTFHSKDMSTVSMRLAGETTMMINIHNVYNPPPYSYMEDEETEPIEALAQALRMPGEHIMMGDFNLHYLLWSGTERIH